MAKKLRPEPFTQGSLAEIYRHFFGRLIHHKPESISIGEWLEMLFDFSNRDVIRYVAHKGFLIPGLLYVAGSVKVQGLGYRKVKRGDVLWVRRDARDGLVDVEWEAPRGPHIKHGGEQVFALTDSEWGWVKLHVREEEKERKR